MLRLAFVMLCAILVDGKVLQLRDYDVVMNDKYTLVSVVPKRYSKILDLSNMDIAGIGPFAFENVSHITFLNMSHNDLRILPLSSFYDLTKLKTVILSQNNLFLLPYVFAGLTNLETLDISENDIKILRRGSLYGIPNTTHVLASGNSFKPGKFESILQKALEKPYDLLNVCIVNGTIKFLRDFSLDSYQESKKQHCPVTPRNIVDGMAIITNLDITGFENGWYQVQDADLLSINLENNHIEHLTNEFLDGIPETMETVYIASNNIDTSNAGGPEHKNYWKLSISEKAQIPGLFGF